MDVWYLFKAVKNSSYDVCYSFTNYSKDYGKSTGVVERLECHEDCQTHQHIACCLQIALSLHLAETQSCSYKGAQPYESEYYPSPCGFTSCPHGDECKRGVAAGNMPVDGRVVELTGDFLCLFS